MKHRKVICTAIIVALMLVLTVPVMSVSADGSTVLFFTPNANWKSDNARFAVYLWKQGGAYTWINMTDSNSDGVYEAVTPQEYKNLIFCRMDCNSAENNWDNVWNQTSNLSLPTDGNNHYTVKSGTWSNGGGEWSYFDSPVCIHIPAGEGTLVKEPTCNAEGEISYTCSECGENYTITVSVTGHRYNEQSICTDCGKEFVYIIAGNVMKYEGEYRSGDNSTLFVSSWDIEDENNRMKYDPDAELHIKIYKNVAAGEYHFKVVENGSWSTSYGDGDENYYLKVEKDGSTVTIIFSEGDVSADSTLPTANNQINNLNPDNAENNLEDSKEDLNFFQRIWLAIVNFFKNLFGREK